MNTVFKSKRQLQTEHTKRKLFHAAAELLEKEDFKDITIRDIVCKANVSIGTFYNYYSTKMDVFYETYHEADQYFADTVAPLLLQADTIPVQERVLRFFEHYAHYSSEQTDIKMTKLLYNPDNTYFNRTPEHGMVGVLIDLLQEGLDKGEFRSSETAGEMAEYLMIAMRGLVYNWLTRDGEYDLIPAARTFASKLLKAYLP